MVRDFWLVGKFVSFVPLRGVLAISDFFALERKGMPNPLHFPPFVAERDSLSPAQAVRRLRRCMNPARPAPRATRAAVVGSGTMLMKPVVALNVAVCPDDKPV